MDAAFEKEIQKEWLVPLDFCSHCFSPWYYCLDYWRSRDNDYYEPMDNNTSYDDIPLSKDFINRCILQLLLFVNSKTSLNLRGRIWRISISKLYTKKPSERRMSNYGHWQKPIFYDGNCKFMDIERKQKIGGLSNPFEQTGR